MASGLSDYFHPYRLKPPPRFLCPCGISVKNPPAGADTGVIPGLGRSLGGGHGNLLAGESYGQRSLWATVHRVAKSQTWLKLLSRHVCIDFYHHQSDRVWGNSTPRKVPSYVYLLSTNSLWVLWGITLTSLTLCQFFLFLGYIQIKTHGVPCTSYLFASLVHLPGIPTLFCA